MLLIMLSDKGIKVGVSQSSSEMSYVFYFYVVSCQGNLNTYFAHTLTCGGQSKGKSVLTINPSLTSLAPIQRKAKESIESLIDLGGKSKLRIWIRSDSRRLVDCYVPGHFLRMLS